MTHPTTISVVLGTLNRLPYLQAAVESVRQSQISVPVEIIVVDGGSSDGTLVWLAQNTNIITVIQHNIDYVEGQRVRKRSWGYFMNLGFKIAQGELICMLSDDSLLHPDALANGILAYQGAISTGRQVGGVAFYWRNYPEEADYRIGYTLGGRMFVNHGLYVREALYSVKCLEEDYLTFYFADGDVCLKMAEAGYEVISSDNSYVEHFESPKQHSTYVSSPLVEKEWQKYLGKWEGKFYNKTDSDTGHFIYKSGPAPKTTDSLVPQDIKRLIRQQQSSNARRGKRSKHFQFARSIYNKARELLSHPKLS